PIFSGNIIRQPAYKKIKYRVAGELKNSEKIMKDSFFIGIHPGINENMLNYIIDVFENFIEEYR
ncbi:MAG: DegT/DnrJ/EryC1/StrS family aminotransferase, partial [Nitrososphaeria archaeon]|nr:DegT/DnrJ/EryC1/StrS family aminotransferase [Nitrososphaeria archaeon]